MLELSSDLNEFTDTYNVVKFYWSKISVNKHAEMKNRDEKIVKLFTLDPTKMYFRQAWLPVHLDHPSTFSTLAMDSDVKDTVMKDLDRFLERREFYREKRGSRIRQMNLGL
nr:AAA-ATPase At3g50940-like [Tanacetum cinerariifolium]